MSQSAPRNPGLLLVGITTVLAVVGLALPGLLGASGVLAPDQQTLWILIALPVIGVWAVVAIVWVVLWRRRDNRERPSLEQ